MAKENEGSKLTGPLVMGVGGVCLMAGLAYALSFSAGIFVQQSQMVFSGLLGGIAFLFIGLGLQEILLLAGKRSRRQSG